MFKNYLDKIKALISKRIKKGNKGEREKALGKRQYSEINHGVYTLKKKGEKVNTTLNNNLNKNNFNYINASNKGYDDSSKDNCNEKEHKDINKQKRNKKKTGRW